jgi:DNA-binding NarL/FixJ family response regulator
MVELLVAEPQSRFRAALCTLLRRQHDLHLAGEGAEALPLVRATPGAQLLLLGLQHGHAGDFGTLSAVRSLRRELPVLVLGSYDEASLVQAWRRAGAQGYLLRDEQPERLLFALRLLAQGGVFFLGDSEQRSQPFADGPSAPPPPTLH